MEIFKRAAKLKLRFATTNGLCRAEDLYDLPLEQNHTGLTSLENLAQAINRDVKESEQKSFVGSKSKTNELAQLKLDVVKAVIADKLDAAENASKELAKSQRKQELLELLSDKHRDEDRKLSKEEILKLIDDL